MKTYHDKWGCYIIERELVFEDSCGYVAIATLTPTRWWTKLLSFLGLARPSVLLIDFCEDFKETISITLSRKRNDRNVYSGVFTTTKGRKTMKISIDPDSVDNWHFKFKVERLYN